MVNFIPGYYKQILFLLIIKISLTESNIVVRSGCKGNLNLSYKLFLCL